MTTTDNPHYVTPEEAKKKICLSSMGGLLMVHDAVMASEHECYGPDCMAWRWTTYFEYDENTLKREEKFSTTHGYCGMVQSWNLFIGTS